VQALAAVGRQPQLRWVREGHIQELHRRVAWSQSHMTTAQSVKSPEGLEGSECVTIHSGYWCGF
jgi:hypothetical protein